MSKYEPKPEKGILGDLSLEIYIEGDKRGIQEPQKGPGRQRQAVRLADLAKNPDGTYDLTGLSKNELADLIWEEAERNRNSGSLGKTKGGKGG